MADMGLFGLPIPEEYGGSGADFVTYSLAVEEISRASASLGITMAAHTSFGALPIYLFGSEEQKQKWLDPARAGEDARRVRPHRAGRRLRRRRHEDDGDAQRTASGS